MARSQWKGPLSFFKNVRVQTIRPSEKKEKVYTGKTWKLLNIITEQVGHKYGEFVFSKTSAVFKKGQKN